MSGRTIRVYRGAPMTGGEACWAVDIAQADGSTAAGVCTFPAWEAREDASDRQLALLARQACRASGSRFVRESASLPVRVRRSADGRDPFGPEA